MQTRSLEEAHERLTTGAGEQPTDDLPVELHSTFPLLIDPFGSLTTEFQDDLVAGVLDLQSGK